MTVVVDDRKKKTGRWWTAQLEKLDRLYTQWYINREYRGTHQWKSPEDYDEQQKKLSEQIAEVDEVVRGEVEKIILDYGAYRGRIEILAFDSRQNQKSTATIRGSSREGASDGQ